MHMYSYIDLSGFSGGAESEAVEGGGLLTNRHLCTDTRYEVHSRMCSNVHSTERKLVVVR